MSRVTKPDFGKLATASILARSDLARGLKFVEARNRDIAEQQYQSIRLITIALDDADTFCDTWERWRNEDEHHRLIPFKNLMEI